MHKYLAFFLIFIVSVSAQELDKDFLNSLPDNLREDFLDKSQSNLEEEIDASNPDTRIKNLEKSLKEAETLLKRISIELNDDNKNKALDDLQRFGASFFGSYQSTFMPINEPNLGSHYILDVDDELTIQLVGQRNETIKTLVKRDGTISLPEIGNISVVGLDLDSAFELLKNQINSSVIGTESFLSLSKLRDVNVLIVGNVTNPGIYTVSGGASSISLINIAGGITEGGSFRNIQHKRENKIINTIDLYDLFINGNFNYSHGLRSGDVLIVNQSYPEVRVSGGVLNEGIFEIKPDENLSHIIKFSGLRPFHSSDKAQLQRRYEGEFISEDIDINSRIKLFDGDALIIPSVKPKFNSVKTITLTGEFRVPGEYQIANDTKLSDIIELAGGYTETAYPLGGVYQSQVVKEFEEELKEKGYNELIRFLISSQGGSASPFSTQVSSDSIVTFLSLLKEYEASGRVVTEFEISKLKKDPNLDRSLDNGDRIHIPSFSSQVYVFGEIMNPGGIQFDASHSILDYINNTGGLSRAADETRVILISPNGKTIPIKFGLFSKLGNSNFEILPGSVIYIPRHIGKVDGINLASTLAPIVSSFALSVASINSINN